VVIGEAQPQAEGWSPQRGGQFGAQLRQPTGHQGAPALFGRLVQGEGARLGHQSGGELLVNGESKVQARALPCRGRDRRR
jgi:hypothetical protein